LGSIGAILAAGSFLYLSNKIQDKLVPFLISYATGTLLSTALLGMIPGAIQGTGGNITSILSFVLVGIIFFFIVEKLVIWRHCHDPECEVHGAANPIILFGDAFHNLTDGIVIAASFLTDFYIGIIVSISVIAHEIPQEVGDFAILINGGYSKKKAFIYNALSGASTIPGGIISYFILDAITIAIPYALAISAASFLYIALSDLTPELHKKIGLSPALRQFILLMAGIGTMSLFFIFKP